VIKGIEHMAILAHDYLVLNLQTTSIRLKNRKDVLLDAKRTNHFPY
jgi:hypothetical protein